MNFRTNHESIITEEEVYSGITEQSVELDYILPDYYPDVFRMLRCFLTPCLVSTSVSGGRISIELTAQLSVWYYSEDGTLQNLSQKLNYSRQLDTGTGRDELFVNVSLQPDYINCRAVNKRRLDVRGAISCRICATAKAEHEIVDDAFGMGIQLKREQVSAVREVLHTGQTFRLEEELELGASKPASISILKSAASISVTERKLVSGKLVVRGEADVSVLYLSPDGLPERMDASIPYSQVIDIEGLSEAFDCCITPRVLCCDASGTSAEGGEAHMLKLSVEASLSCLAVRMGELNIITDAFSTLGDVSIDREEIPVELKPLRLNECLNAGEQLADATVSEINDAWCDCEAISVSLDEEALVLTCKLKWHLLARSDGMPMLLEKDSVISHSVPLSIEGVASIISDICATVRSCSYSLSADGVISMKAELCFAGCVRLFGRITGISELSVDTDESASEGFALKLYYAHAGEDIWDIAKHCGASAEDIAEENGLTADHAEEDGMLMIILR